MATLTVDERTDHALPPGYTARPLRLDDVPAITAMLNAESRHLIGVDKYVENDVMSDWTWGGADPELNSRLLFAPDGTLAGYEGFWAEDSAQGMMYIWGRIHPAHTGRGLASHLLAWAEQRAQDYLHLAPADARVALVMGIPAINQPGQQVLLDHAYQPVRHFFRMVVDLTEPPAAPQWPAGIQTRTYRIGPDDRPVALMVRDAFRDHWGFVDRDEEIELDAWRKLRLENPEFDPSLCFLAVDGEEVVGINLCRLRMHDDPQMGYVNTLAVSRSWRKRGLGEALLRHSFQEFYRRGQLRAALNVDASNLTGAMRLYEKVGMHPDPQRTVIRLEKVLRAGKDLRQYGVD